MSSAAILIVLLLLLPLAGCAGVQKRDAEYASCPTGKICAYDIRTGKHWFQRVFSQPHRVLVYRDDKGVLHPPIVEESQGDMLEEMSGPLSGIASHVTIPVIP